MENKKRNIKTVVDTRTSIRTPIPLMVFLWIYVENSVANCKINAAQASHLGRIARECRACRFAALGGEVCARETAFPKGRTFLAHSAGDSPANLDPGN
jgi:hypothetical protein